VGVDAKLRDGSGVASSIGSTCAGGRRRTSSAMLASREAFTITQYAMPEFEYTGTCTARVGRGRKITCGPIMIS
jgi:hypothetical protein